MAGDMRGAVATLPLLVRLELPRFYVRHDEAVVSAVVHNYTNETRAVRARIEATGATLRGEAQRTLQLVGGGQRRLDWNARITDAAHARFLVVADGGLGAQDAMELTLPVHLDGLKMVEATATSLDENNATHRLNLADVPRGATVTLTLSPSIASAMFDALDYLTASPYGCAEQTMSSFLPDVIVARTLRRLNVQRKVHPNRDQWVNLGLQKLYRYQHGDGGWNWWEFDQTDGDMTAYVLWGLIQAKEAGYLVDDQRLLRGTEALLRLLANERELSKRADWMLTLAHVQPERIAKPLAELFAKRDKLDTHAQASLCLALAELGGRRSSGAEPNKQARQEPRPPTPAEFRQMAATVARELEAKAMVRGTTAHWSAEEGGYSWRSDEVEVTARVLRALLTVSPTSRSVQPAVRWSTGNRRGKAWSSTTKASAEAVYALAQFLERTKELQPEFTARVSLDGHTVREFSATARNVFDAPLTLTFTPEQLRQGRSALTVDKQGVGTLYVTTTFTYTLPGDKAKPMSKGISVRRLFRVTAEDPAQADTVASGQEIEVAIEITADANYRYAILEDPIPAGCEVAPTDDISGRYGFFDAEGGGGFARQEVRDDKVVFFFNDLRKGRTRLTCRLHAETPGVYRVLPSVALLMYFPEVRGNSGLVRAKIGESMGQ